MIATGAATTSYYCSTSSSGQTTRTALSAYSSTYPGGPHHCHQSQALRVPVARCWAAANLKSTRGRNTFI
eukprot:3879936-Rhodomonas_salina.1